MERLIDSEEKNKQRDPELAQAELSRLKQAHDRSKEILNHVNEAAKIACNRARLKEMQKHLDTSLFEKFDHSIVNEYKVNAKRFKRGSYVLILISLSVAEFRFYEIQFNTRRRHAFKEAGQTRSFTCSFIRRSCDLIAKGC